MNQPSFMKNFKALRSRSRPPGDSSTTGESDWHGYAGRLSYFTTAERRLRATMVSFGLEYKTSQVVAIARRSAPRRRCRPIRCKPISAHHSANALAALELGGAARAYETRSGRPVQPSKIGTTTLADRPKRLRYSLRAAGAVIVRVTQTIRTRPLTVICLSRFGCASDTAEAGSQDAVSAGTSATVPTEHLIAGCALERGPSLPSRYAVSAARTTAAKAFTRTTENTLHFNPEDLFRKRRMTIQDLGQRFQAAPQIFWRTLYREILGCAPSSKDVV